MSGLHYLSCPACGTVYAVPDEPEECDRCGAAGLEPLPSDPAAAAYFTRGLHDGSE